MAEVCRSCGAAVRWVETETGTPMPVDMPPVAHGNLVRIRPARGGRPTVRYLRAGETPPVGVPRYVSHFATCPQAREWRRPKAAS